MPFVPDNQKTSSFVPDNTAPTSSFVPDEPAQTQEAQQTSPAPQQQGGIGQAISQGFRNTMGAGLINKGTLPGVIYKAATGNDLISKDENYEPQGVANKAAYYATNMGADPINVLGGSIGKGALKATGMLPKLERLAAMSLAERIAPEAIQQTITTGMKAGAIEGSAVAGSFSGAQEAIQQLEEGKFDPAALAYQTSAGMLFGGVTGGAVGRYGASREANFLQAKSKVQDIYEGAAKFSKELDTIPLNQNTEGLYGEAFSNKVAQNRNEMLALHNKISTLESAREGALARAATAQTAEESAQWQQKAAEHLIENSSNQNQFLDKYGGQPYETLMKYKRAYAGTTIKIGSQEVPAFDYALGKEGIVIDPDTAKVFANAKDLQTSNPLKIVAGKINAGWFGAKDAIRMLVQSEGMGGPMQRALFDGIAKGDESFQKEIGKFGTEFEQVANAAGVRRRSWFDKSSKDASTRVFDHLEGKDVQLTPSEQHLASWVKTHYENTLGRLNQVRLANNLTPIKSKDNYITHLQSLGLLEKYGIDLGSSQMAELPENLRRIGFRFENARTGAEAAKDVYEAVTSYTSNALRSIHMTQPRQQAMALTEMMDNAPNLQKGLQNFLNGPNFGGLAGIDKFLIENSLGFLPKLANSFQRALGRGSIIGNAGILAEQPSQMIPTAAITGPKYAAQALAAVMPEWAGGGVPENLMKMSRVLSQRNLAEEAGQQLGRSSRNIVGKGLATAEQVSRHMMETVDNGVAKHSFMAAFLQGKKSYGLSDEAAVRYADDVTRQLHGIYRDIYRPLILQNKVIKGFIPFSTFGFNLWNSLTTDSAARAAMLGTSSFKQTAKLMAAMELTNFIYDNSGFRKPYDMGALAPTNYGRNDDGDIKFTGQSVLPKVGPLGSFGTPAIAQKSIEGAQLLHAGYKLAFDEEHDLDDRKKAFDDIAIKFGKSFVPFGQQIYNTVRGYQGMRDGYTTIGKDTEVALDPKDKALGLVFGPQNTPSVRKARLNNLH